jgi:16S rRNA C967 or C1407 C5-methylase (RsmB/RsmF family)/NOL1/NOP2/fmu family ribosome biogenesis protein
MQPNLPDAFVELMRNDLGEVEAEKLFKALDTEAVVSLRLHPLKSVECYNGEIVGWCKWGRYLVERPQFTLDPLMHGGAYYVQEASSQFVAHLLGGLDMDGKRVLDMCAAPGGKSTIYSTLVGREGLVVANDISRSRAMALADNVQRWGMGNVVVTCNEPKHIGAFGEWFDVVAVDAPCSGEGMFRKMPEARDEWNASSPEVCAERQREIVAEAWRALRPGGVLIYSTCTFNSQEDEGVVKWLMQEYGQELERFDEVATEQEWGIVRSDIGAFQCFHFYPHKARGEGFFAAIARKADGAVRRVTPKARRKVFVPLAKSDVAEVVRWVDDANSHSFMAIGDMIYAYNKRVVNDVVALSESLSVVYSGVAMGQIYKRKLKPEHPLALYVGFNRDAVPVVDVDLETAQEYLRRHDVMVAEFEEGINAVSYKGVAIGFVKRIGARCNNMYPKDLRIIKL